MKIAYICSDVDVEVLGHEGCSVHVRELTNAMIECGHEVVILCAWPGSGAESEAKARVVHPSPGGLAETACAHLDEEPVIYEHCLERDLKSVIHNLWLEGEGLEILRGERPDFIYERYALFGWGGINLAAKLRIPHVLEINAPLCDQQEGYEKFVLTQLARKMEAEIFRASDALVVLSPWLRTWAISLGAQPSRVHLIPDAVSERVFAKQASGDDVRKRYGLEGKRTIGFVGSFQHWHDVPGLLETFQLLYRKDPDLRLLLVGEGLERERCGRIARELGVSDTVVFTGSVPHEQVPQYVAAMDVATVPYAEMNDFYFSPMKLFEYMAAGRPTVAASLGQIAEVVDHGRDGWLYEPGNAQSLAQGIDTILYNPTLGADMGAAARAKVLANHTWRNVALQVIDLARSLIAAKTGDPRKELQPA